MRQYPRCFLAICVPVAAHDSISFRNPGIQTGEGSMSQPIDRRQFQKRFSAALAATAVLPLGCNTQGPASEAPALSATESRRAEAGS